MAAMTEIRYCSECGRAMVPFTPSRYPDDEWVGCPIWVNPFRSFWSYLMGDGNRHDVAIVGLRSRRRKYDRATGKPL
jgi:hypothetical protein